MILWVESAVYHGSKRGVSRLVETLNSMPEIFMVYKRPLNQYTHELVPMNCLHTSICIIYLYSRFKKLWTRMTSEWYVQRLNLLYRDKIMLVAGSIE